MTLIMPASPPPAPTPEAPEANPRSVKSVLTRVLVSLLLVLAGMGLLLYPVAATQLNNFKQRQFSQQYNTQVANEDPSHLKEDLRKARDYNAHIQGIPILDPWLPVAATDPGSAPYQDYSHQLSRFEAMARVRVPSVDIDLPVHHGTSDEVLGKGAGHLYGTALPVGGIGTHAVLTSHTGMPNATLFDHLNKVKEGDMIYVEVSGETLAYKIDQISIILPTEIDQLGPVPGKDYLALFTCTPYAVNTHRLLVRGERVPFTAAMAEEAAPPAIGLKMEPWMWALIGGAGLGLVALLTLLVWERRKNTVAKAEAAGAVGKRAAVEEETATRDEPTGRRAISWDDQSFGESERLPDAGHEPPDQGEQSAGGQAWNVDPPLMSTGWVADPSPWQRPQSEFDPWNEFTDPKDPGDPHGWSGGSDRT